MKIIKTDKCQEGIIKLIKISNQEWKDTTSYSRSDTKRIPRIYELKINDLRIIVHRVTHLEGWFLSVYHKLPIRDRFLGDIDIEDAKQEAIKIIIAEISELEKTKAFLKML